MKIIKDLELKHDLIDIWRIRNPETKRFTWRQKTPIIRHFTNDAIEMAFGIDLLVTSPLWGKTKK